MIKKVGKMSDESKVVSSSNMCNFRKCFAEGSKMDKNNGCEFDLITFEPNCHAKQENGETGDVILAGLNSVQSISL